MKDNHPTLLESILLTHADVAGPVEAASTCETRSRGHGRVEVRLFHAFEAGARLYKAEQWPDLSSFATVKRTRIVAGKKSVERRHYISSLAPDADKIAHAVRSHWEVEKRLHWCLDMQFSDDYARAHSGHVAQNLALVSHIALNLIRLNTSRKASIKNKRLLAATSDEYRAELLGLETQYEEDDDK